MKYLIMVCNIIITFEEFDYLRWKSMKSNEEKVI